MFRIFKYMYTNYYSLLFTLLVVGSKVDLWRQNLKNRFLIGGVFILNNKNVITVFLIIERDFFILFCKLISLLSAIGR